MSQIKNPGISRAWRNDGHARCNIKPTICCVCDTKNIAQKIFNWVLSGLSPLQQAHDKEHRVCCVCHMDCRLERFTFIK